MGMIEKLEEIKCSPEKFYNFYRYNLTEFSQIFPDKFFNIGLVKGKQNCVNSVSNWSYQIDGKQMNANIKIDTFDDENMTLTVSFIGGDVKKFYKSLKSTLEVNKGFAKLIFEFEKSYEDAPDPDTHAEFTSQVMIKDLDDYLVNNSS